jgi:hypothetical protein
MNAQRFVRRYARKIIPRLALAAVFAGLWYICVKYVFGDEASRLRYNQLSGLIFSAAPPFTMSAMIYIGAAWLNYLKIDRLAALNVKKRFPSVETALMDRAADGIESGLDAPPPGKKPFRSSEPAPGQEEREREDGKSRIRANLIAAAVLIAVSFIIK